MSVHQKCHRCLILGVIGAAGSFMGGHHGACFVAKGLLLAVEPLMHAWKIEGGVGRDEAANPITMAQKVFQAQDTSPGLAEDIDLVKAESRPYGPIHRKPS